MTWVAVLNTADYEYRYGWVLDKPLRPAGYGVVDDAHPVAARGIAAGILTPIPLTATDPAAIVALERASDANAQGVSPTYQPSLEARVSALEAGGTVEVTQAELDAAVADKVSSGDVATIDVLTQAAYDAIVTKDPATLYVIEG